MSKSARFLISGRVQGVGFRWWTRKQAQRLGVRGWVRNLADGRVEVKAAAESGDMKQFITLLREGPRTGQVIELQQYDLMEDLEVGFLIRT